MVYRNTGVARTGMPVDILSGMRNVLIESIEALVRVHNARKEDIYEHAIVTGA